MDQTLTVVYVGDFFSNAAILSHSFSANYKNLLVQLYVRLKKACTACNNGLGSDLNSKPQDSLKSMW